MWNWSITIKLNETLVRNINEGLFLVCLRFLSCYCVNKSVPSIDSLE